MSDELENMNKPTEMSSSLSAPDTALIARADEHDIDAITDALQFGRASHLLWAEHLEAHTGDVVCEECEERPYKMDATKERAWVARYDQILSLVGSYRDLLARLRALAQEREMLCKIVMAWDSEQDEEFTEAIGEARRRLGLQLVDDHEEVIDHLRTNDEQDLRRNCVHGSFPVHAACPQCDPFRR